MRRPRIIIETVSPAEQRYDTVGDWQLMPDGALLIRVSEDVMEPQGFLIGLHEMIEAFLCLHRGIPQEAVDRFDMAFKGGGEPGDDPAAPYRVEHRFSMIVEHLVAHEIGVDGYGRVE